MTADVDASDNAVYVQDSWRPNSRMTINAGLRLDWIKSEDRQAGIQTQDSLEVGPRFGATYSLTSDRMNVLRASWGRVGELVQAGRVPVLTSSNAGRTDSYDNNLDGVFETVQVTPGASATRRDRVLDPDVHQPYIDEWTVGFRRQFPGQLAIDAGFVKRYYKDRPALVEVNGIYDGVVFRGYRDESLNEIFLVTNDEWNWYDYIELRVPHHQAHHQRADDRLVRPRVAQDRRGLAAERSGVVHPAERVRQRQVHRHSAHRAEQQLERHGRHVRLHWLAGSHGPPGRSPGRRHGQLIVAGSYTVQSGPLHRPGGRSESPPPTRGSAHPR